MKFSLGSGKTTYCGIMKDFMINLNRNVFVINLDPANENLTYDCEINIYELINVDDVMRNCNLGPNGGLLFAIEFLEENFDWLEFKLNNLSKKYPNAYFLFDFPGQIELYTHHKSIKNIIEKLTKLDYRLCSVNLIDSHYCTDPGKFISVLITTLNMMLHIEMPHVNLLSKIDLIEQYGKLAFNIDFFTEVLDLNYLIEQLDNDRIYHKYKKLNKTICDIVEDFSLVHFLPFNIQNKKNILFVLQQIDLANGYVYGNLDNKEVLNSIATQQQYKIYDEFYNIENDRCDDDDDE
jgi:GTPase SAR1 family protein